MRENEGTEASSPPPSPPFGEEREKVSRPGFGLERAGEPPALRGNLHFFGFTIYDIRFTSERVEGGLRRGEDATTFAARPTNSKRAAPGKECHL